MGGEHGMGYTEETEGRKRDRCEPILLYMCMKFSAIKKTHDNEN